MNNELVQVESAEAALSLLGEDVDDEEALRNIEQVMNDSNAGTSIIIYPLHTKKEKKDGSECSSSK